MLTLAVVTLPGLGCDKKLEEVLQSVLRYEKLFLGEILMAILERRLMGTLERMGVSGLGKETVEEWHF